MKVPIVMTAMSTAAANHSLAPDSAVAVRTLKAFSTEMPNHGIDADEGRNRNHWRRFVWVMLASLVVGNDVQTLVISVAPTRTIMLIICVP